MDFDKKHSSGRSERDLTCPRSFINRASQISCFACLAVYMLGILSTVSPLFHELCVAILIAACVLGMCGIIGGISHGSITATILGVLGLLLASVTLALVAWFVS